MGNPTLPLGGAKSPHQMAGNKTNRAHEETQAARGTSVQTILPLLLAERHRDPRTAEICDPHSAAPRLCRTILDSSGRCILYIMRRTQLYIEDDLWKTLHMLARQSRCTVSELVRRALRDKYLNDSAKRKESLLSAVGL